MRCLYCGKHLPLFRKLTGGGEFCSDAHRDNYHEEYNRLAVSRLLQAQSRPEEPKISTSVAEERQNATAVLAEEPEMSEISGSIIDEFRIRQIRPAVARRPLEIEVTAVSMPAEEPALPLPPTVRPPSFALRREAGFLASRAGTRIIVAVPAEIGQPSAYDVAQALPLTPEIRFTDRQPAEAGALALHPPSTPRKSRIGPLEMGVIAIELTKPEPAMPALSLLGHLLALPRVGSLRLVLSSMEVADNSLLGIGLSQSFPGLQELRPSFDLRMKPLDSAVSVATTEPAYQTVANGTAAAAITPRAVLEALSQLQADRKQNESQEPPPNRTIKRIAVSAVAPLAEVLTIGIDAMLFVAEPQLLHYTTQPLRPKMAVGTAAGPLPVRSGRNGAGGKAHSGESMNGASKLLPKSMLHLEDVSKTADSDSEAPSLFGKLGGLFGKKSKTGKPEVTRSRKSLNE
jgi:hypothetical protein